VQYYNIDITPKDMILLIAAVQHYAQCKRLEGEVGTVADNLARNMILEMTESKPKDGMPF
jgi:hypothetical protein